MDNSAQTVKGVIEIVTALGTLIAAWFAAITYCKSVKLERAKWMKELYEKFYERSDLKNVRDVLDGDDQVKISELVKKEGPDFTDYLNFFEFVAFLHQSKQISKQEVLGVFEYYLRNLKQHKDVADYIATRSKGFERLDKLLKTNELLKTIEQRNGE